MIAAEKIYYAHQKLKVSFKTIAYLTEMDESEVKRLYHCFKDELNKDIVLTLEDSIERLGMSVFTTNQFKRYGIRTIRRFAKLSKDELKSMKNLGTKRRVEAFAAWDVAQAVLRGGKR